MIHVIDYKLGNIGSVVNMLNYLGAEVKIATAPEDIDNATKLILPGVGAFDAGTRALKQSGLDEAIKLAVKNNKAMILGVCLGMQLLMEFSEEGDSLGLGLVPGCVKKIVLQNENMRVPHMGWNAVEVVRDNKLINKIMDEDRRYYFVHSYCAHCFDNNDIVGNTFYGSKFTSIFERGGVMGVQFHPEKSHRYGMELLQNFMAVS